MKKEIQIKIPEYSEYKIRSTKNYKMFKVIDGNRDVTHSSKIKKSIVDRGLLLIPVLVNEKYEVIDGQGRLEACSQLDIPVYYVCQPGLTIRDVRYLNTNMTKWTLKDYSKSSSVESEDFKYLENLRLQFPEFSLKVLLVATGSCGITGGGSSKVVKKETYRCTEKQYEDAIKALYWLRGCVKSSEIEKKGNYKGSKESLYLALLFCYRESRIDNKKMVTKLSGRCSTMPNITKIEQAIVALEEVYNYNVRKTEYVDIQALYKEKLREVSFGSAKKG